MNQLETSQPGSAQFSGGGQALAPVTPQDVTTNLSLVLKALQSPVQRQMLEQIVAEYAHESHGQIMDRLLLAFGQEMSKAEYGWSSTEGDAVRGVDSRGPLQHAKDIMAIAGCDLMIIRPVLLGNCVTRDSPLQPLLKPMAATQVSMARMSLDESAVRPILDDDVLATRNLAAGIRQFVADAIALERLIDDMKACER